MHTSSVEVLLHFIICMCEIKRFDWLKAEGAITCFVWPSRAMISNIALPENTPAISLTSLCRFCDVTMTIVIVTLK